MEPLPLSEAGICDILLTEEERLRPKADRMWEMIKIEPERWHAPVYGSGSASFWAVGVFGNRVVWYNEIEREFVISTFKTYGKIGPDGFGPTEFAHVMETLIRHVEGEQAYTS